MALIVVVVQKENEIFMYHLLHHYLPQRFLIGILHWILMKKSRRLWMIKKMDIEILHHLN